MSIVARFLLGFSLVLVVGLYSLVGSVLHRVERQYMEAAEELMVDVAHILAEVVAVDVRTQGSLETGGLAEVWQAAQGRAFEARIYSLVKERVDMDFYVTDAQGRMLFDSAGR